MCDIWKRTETDELSYTSLAKQMPYFRQLGVEWVVFSGGEPLMHSDLAALATLFRSEGIKLTLLTTGLLLSAYAADVNRAFDEVIISLDGPRDVHDSIRRIKGAYDKVRDGIQTLRKRGQSPVIRARTTVQKANTRHLVATVSAAKEIGFDTISFLAADLTSSAFNRELVWPVSRQEQVGLTRQDVEALREQIDTLITLHAAEIASGFVVETRFKLRQIVRQFEAHLGMREPVAPRCNAPWVSAVVEPDGNVRPCFFHQAFGNANREDFASIVNGIHAISFRESLDVATNPTCQRCVCSLYRPLDHSAAG